MTTKNDLRNRVSALESQVQNLTEDRDRLTTELTIASAKVNRLEGDIAHHKGRTERAEKDRDRYKNGLEELRTKVADILTPKVKATGYITFGDDPGDRVNIPSIVFGPPTL
ncbi:hypothetical protein SEA_CHOTABHAI_104 [Mycobacterium phage ChotaBhai]|nr:hypothetical protein SEA_CHOTABHAI_104 [Mycobacterium phage ChotaBhai]